MLSERVGLLRLNMDLNEARELEMLTSVAVLSTLVMESTLDCLSVRNASSEAMERLLCSKALAHAAAS